MQTSASGEGREPDSPASAQVKSLVANEALANALDRQTVVGTLWRVEGGRVRCVACGHRCLIAPGRRGICKVRFNASGQLRVPFGYTAGVACDPVEKKPFFHVYPGADALTFGMLGCDFHCSYCQNWVTSQALRDEAASASLRPVAAEELVQAARRHGAQLMVSSYNEPLITAEWAVDVFREARQAGLLTGFVSNGNATPEVLRYLRPWLDLYKVDLKSFHDHRYRELGGRLGPILDSIERIYDMGFWLEIVTLVVPGFNDSPAELQAMGKFIAGVSADIPWHLTAFHPDYKMISQEDTSSAALLSAVEIGREAGLKFVYAGNLPNQVGASENTCCPSCRATLIRRRGFRILENRLKDDGVCPDCNARIPGVWARSKAAPPIGTPNAVF